MNITALTSTFLLAATLASSNARAQIDDLPLVENRTSIAADVLARQLPQLPTLLVDQAACIAVVSRDAVGWGLAGAELGAGLVSCRIPGGWSAPSYLALGGFDLGPNIGFMNQAATLLFLPPARSEAFRSSLTFGAGVYAIAGSAEVQISVDSDGCAVFDMRRTRRRNCVVAFSEDFGLRAGAFVSIERLRHMSGFLGAGRVGRNARVYGRGVSVRDILTMPEMQAPDLTLDWIRTLDRFAP